MKAARLHAYGDVDQFHYEEAPDPVAGEGEVVIKLAATSLNPVDLYVRQGYLQQMLPIVMPATIGIDVAGTIASVGPGVTGFAVGDRVIGKLPLAGPGSLAELVTAKVGQIAKLPPTVSFEVGATLPLVGLTGRQAVEALGQLVPGERVLVTGALGGVGRAAVQYLKARGAAPVAGVRAERLDEGKALAGEAVAVGETATPSFGYAIDTAGGPLAAFAAASVRDGGLLAAVAGIPDGTNADDRIRIANVLSADNPPMLREIAEAAAKGELTIPVAQRFRLAEIAEAHRALATPQIGGKVIVTP